MSERPPSALILGGAHGALVIARSLARRGIPVDIVANHPLPLFSRHIRHRFSWDESGHGPGPDALPRLLALAERERLAGAVLFAGGDTEVRFIAENHAALASVFRLTTPPWDALQRLFDKRLMQQHAAALGVDVPLAYAAQRSPRPRHHAAALPAGAQADGAHGGECLHARQGVAGRRPREPARALGRGGGAGRRRRDRRAGADPGRRRGAILLRGGVRPRQAGRRAGGAPAPAVSGRVRLHQHLRRDGRLPAGRGRRAAPARLARLHRHRRGRVQARPARRPLQAARRQYPDLDLGWARRRRRRRLSPCAVAGRVRRAGGAAAPEPRRRLDARLARCRRRRPRDAARTAHPRGLAALAAAAAHVRRVRARRSVARAGRAAARAVARRHPPAADRDGEFWHKVVRADPAPPTPGPDSRYSLSRLRRRMSCGRAD